MFSPQGVQVNLGGRSVKSCDTATSKASLPSLEGALVYLHTVFHLACLHKPEFGVYNPKPSKPTGDYVFPADMFLKEEGKKLETMDLVEFVSYARTLVQKKKVPAISVTADIDNNDNSRYTMQIMFAKDLVKLLNGEYLCLESVSGDSKITNQWHLKKCMAACQKALEAIPDEELAEAML